MFVELEKITNVLTQEVTWATVYAGSTFIHSVYKMLLNTYCMPGLSTTVNRQGNLFIIFKKSQVPAVIPALERWGQTDQGVQGHF